MINSPKNNKLYKNSIFNPVDSQTLGSSECGSNLPGNVVTNLGDVSSALCDITKSGIGSGAIPTKGEEMDFSHLWGINCEKDAYER